MQSEAECAGTLLHTVIILYYNLLLPKSVSEAELLRSEN